MRYGVLYKGSKNKIAREIVDILPPARHFCDLFAGGCAITHAAMLSGKWERFTANDLDGGGVQLFRNAVNGEYRNESRWMSREMFSLLKECDPYVKYMWSYGSNGEHYLYAKEVEPLKKALHEVFFSATPHEARRHWRQFVREFGRMRQEADALVRKVLEFCEGCGVEPVRRSDGTICATSTKKYLKGALSSDMCEYMRDALKSSGRTAADVDRLLGTNGMAGHYFGKSQWELPAKEAYEKMQAILPGLKAPWAELNERLQRLERLERLESLERLENLTISTKDYQDVELEPDSVIYCDIPYKGAGGYGKGGFDHERFYAWAERQECPVFVSEYWMPEDRFTCVWERAKTSPYGTGNSKKTVEKLFIPKHQVKSWNK